jgi:trimethylamine:corrinoid methyltransferase-like protein
MAVGRADAVIRAQQRWHELLEEHVDPPLDDITARQLAAFVEKCRS